MESQKSGRASYEKDCAETLGVYCCHCLFDLAADRI